MLSSGAGDRKASSVARAPSIAVRAAVMSAGSTKGSMASKVMAAAEEAVVEEAAEAVLEPGEPPAVGGRAGDGAPEETELMASVQTSPRTSEGRPSHQRMRVRLAARSDGQLGSTCHVAADGGPDRVRGWVP